jgi:hypothetical protein
MRLRFGVAVFKDRLEITNHAAFMAALEMALAAARHSASAYSRSLQPGSLNAG